MRTRARVRPSRSSSAMGMVMGLVFVGIGVFVIIPSSSSGPGDFGFFFGVFWTFCALATVILSAVNTFSSHGIAHEVIEAETTGYQSPPSARDTIESAEQRLAKLDSLRNKQLISQAEYETQRERILSEI